LKNFGVRFLFVLVAIGSLAGAAARGYRSGDDYDFREETPEPTDSPETNLRFPIYDRTGDPRLDSRTPGSIDLADPENVERRVEYDPVEGRYYLSERVGGDYIRNPSYLTMEEYLQYQGRQDENDYFRRRLDALSLFNKKPELPQMYKEGLFDRIFGGNSISVRPQGNIDVTLGVNSQNVKNPTLTQRAQKYSIFDFDLQMNINLLATIGDKLKLNISQNTKATFDFQNINTLQYSGKEDEILKQVQAGTVSFPLRSSLISGAQSLFGLKVQTQFGRLWMTNVISQQRSKRQTLTIQGGAQTNQFALKADDYEEFKHFLLGQYFRANYNRALSTFPVIQSLVTINKIEVWVTNRTGAVEGVRDVIGFMDLGERAPYRQRFTDFSVRDSLPANGANTLYAQLQQLPAARQQGTVTQTVSNPATLGLALGEDFVRVTARKLQPTEYTFNPQLGYLSLNAQPNPDDIVCVAYRYTYNGRVYQVGEFSEDLPPDSTSQKLIFLKLLKGTAPNVNLPIWDLMMKNVYALGGFGLSRDDFRLNVLYQDPGGGEKRYIPEGPSAGVPLITLLNLDRLNIQNDPTPDGVFDYVEGFTINSQQGKIIFPVLEPFGQDLAPALGAGNPQLQRKYLYSILYDSTKTIARQFQQANRYVIRGSFRSSSSSEIFLNAFNIPQGSVTVTAGGQLLVEGQDYSIDYGIGKLRILNTGLLASGSAINVSYEDNATFGFQQQNFLGTRLDYYVNPKLALGGTMMRLTERPFTQKTLFGEDPIRNTVLGLDAAYNSEAPGLTRILDKLPIYSTTATSFITATGEVASLLPGHPKQINALDGPAGSVYLDDFEGTRSSYDLKFPASAWTLATTPEGARGPQGQILFPEATLRDSVPYNRNRARLAWYFIEPRLVDGSTGVPDYIKNDPNQHYIRLVQQQEVFPQRSYTTFNAVLPTLDLAFYPRQRGPYNFEPLQQDGTLSNPRERWGGIQRNIEFSDFEQSNVEFMEFWVMDPFINNPAAQGGQLYIHLGNVSEDVLKDGRIYFENGITYPKDPTKLDRTRYGFVPRFQQQITRAFDNTEEARRVQDVGYDGLDDGEERQVYATYLAGLAATFGSGSPIYQAAEADPAGDNYRYFLDGAYNSAGTGVLGRYKAFNNPQGNSPVTDPTAAVSNAATVIPESEDINRDNTLNEAEDYYQYRIDMRPGMDVGTNFIVSKQVSNVKLPNGEMGEETWYQFKVPIREFQQRVGGISDFRSIRFMRMFLNGFEDSVVLRMARVELGRNQWRRYMFSLTAPGENIPEEDLQNTDFNVTSVSLEENSEREPVAYVIPPGVERQQAAVANGQNIALNEQALALQVCGLKDGDARAVFKEVGVDMRQFERFRMFIHAESQPDRPVLRDGDVRAIIRIGSDFTNNYYEYQVPLAVTRPGERNASYIWPEANRVDLLLNDLVQVKTERNSRGLPAFVPYSQTREDGTTIVVVGNPNVGDAKTILLGVMNPKKTADIPSDDGLEKCAEVWFNEMRATGLNETPGYAAAGKVQIQLADLGSIRAGGSLHTQGYGNIDQKVNQRRRDNFYQYDASTNINAGRLLPRAWGVQLPVFVGHSESVSNPQFDPYDLDVQLKDKLAAAEGRRRDSIRKAAQDYTGITSFNVSNARILGNPERQSAGGGQPKPWSPKNLDLTYAYTRQFKRNPLVEADELVNQRLGLGYAYNVRSKPVEPFKSLVRGRSKWLSLIRDFNFNPLPSTVAFRTELNRVVNETRIREVGGDGQYEIPSLFFKNFTWVRTYSLRWELTRSLSFDYSAVNNSRIDEPYGRIDTRDKRDTLLQRVLDLGRNTAYSHNFNASYNVPLQKLPLTDWTNLRLTYGATYNWLVASRLAEALGNTIGNTQTRQATGELNFAALYEKQRWLRAVNQRKIYRPRDGRNAGPQPRDVRSRDLDPRAPGSRADGDRSGQFGDGSQSAAPVVKSDAPSNAEAPRSDKNRRPQSDSVLLIDNVPVVIAGMSNVQVDSLRKVAKAQEEAARKAAKAKRKAARKAARKARRAQPLEVKGIARTAGRLLTSVKRIQGTVAENSGTILPGWMDSTRVLGLNTATLAPGLDFVGGYQPGYDWLERQAALGRLSTAQLFNGLFQQQYSRTINILGTVEPAADLRIDLTLTSTFSKTHSELFKDTGSGRFTHNNIYETGSFSVSTIGIRSLFNAAQEPTLPSLAYRKFLASRTIISDRLGTSNPYTGGVADPNSPDYQKGYTEFSQDVMVPAFISAYTGSRAEDAPLVDYSARGTRSNPFRGYLPLPNWRITYNGLSKIPAVSNVVQNLVLNHAYTGTLSMNSFVSSLLYQDIFSVGFPSFIDSNSGNYVPFFQVPNITISEQFGPLLGVDAAFRNSLTARFEFRKSRTVSLSMVDYQVAETRSTEYVLGLGYRVRGLTLPFEILGVRKLKNDLNMKVDLGLRDDITQNSFIAQGTTLPSRGQKVITISPSVDYILSDQLTLRLFYDRRQSIPYTTQSFPITTARGGITLRFIFAQ